MNILPTDISKDCETGVEIASFGYYNGTHYIKDKNLEQTTSFTDVKAGTHFIVCCGDVMVLVQPNDFPEIERRVI